MAEIDVTLYFGFLGIITAIAIAIFSPYYINILDKQKRKKALKSALKYETHKNFLECQEKKGFILNFLQELEKGDTGKTPAIYGYLHYTAYESFVLSGFLIEEDVMIQEIIEIIYDEYHTVSHFLATDRDLMTFFKDKPELLRLNKIVIFKEFIEAVNEVEQHKSTFDSIFDVNK